MGQNLFSRHVPRAFHDADDPAYVSKHHKENLLISGKSPIHCDIPPNKRRRLHAESDTPQIKEKSLSHTPKEDSNCPPGAQRLV